MMLVQQQNHNAPHCSSPKAFFRKSSAGTASKEKHLIKTNKQKKANLQSYTVFSGKAFWLSGSWAEMGVSSVSLREHPESCLHGTEL